jgi:hypothetical protein
MFETSSATAKWLWILALLVVANIAYYFYNNWGLVTVKVTDEPLSKVIRSIEWQGWVKIYTNLPPDTKVTMWADHVPLSEAMETLAANVDVPPNPNGDDNPRPRRNRTTSTDPSGGPPSTNAFAGQSTPADPGAGGNPAGPGGPGNPGGAGGQNGPPGGGRGGFGGGGGGGFGRGAQWNLAFFVAPTASAVRQEISNFETNDPGDENKVYTYGTQLQMISTDSTDTAPDPRLQTWPGYKPPAPSTAPAGTTDPGQGNAPNPPAADTPPNVQTYLESFAAAANVWIMAPATWTDNATPPPANSSIISAIRNFVSSTHSSMTEAIILRAGRGGARGGNRSDFGGDDAWADRMRNAINGLPPDERPDATQQLNNEIQFRKDVQALPPDQRRQKMMQHFAERMIYGERLSRLSPVKRAAVFKRMITMRQTAKAAK